MNTEENIDLKFIINLISQEKKALLPISALVFVLAFFLYLFQENVYTSNSVLVGNFSQDDVSSTTDSLSFLKIGSSAATVKSSDVTEFAHKIISSRDWVASLLVRHSLTEEFGVRLEEGKLISEQQAFALHNNFLKRVTFVKDNDDGFFKLAVNHSDPQVAQRLNQLLIDETNNHFREIALIESSKKIEYLTNLLNETRLVDLKNIFSVLTQDEIRRKMQAENLEEYVYKVITPPVLPIQRAYPSKRIFFLYAFAFSLIIFLIYIFLIDYYRNYLEEK